MKAHIEVKDRKEAKLLRLGLEQTDVRAFVLVIGALSTLASDELKIATLRLATLALAERDRLAALDAAAARQQ